MSRRDDSPRIAVVGGGICGLTTAVALEQRGFDVAVYEAAPEYRPVGAGILLQTNALLALESIGVAARIREAGMALSDTEIRSPDGRLLQAFDLGNVEREAFGYGFVAVRRAALLEILRDALDAPVRTGKRCEAVEDPASPTVRFTDGSAVRPDVLVGADGIDSAVREAVAPATARSLDTTVLRALTAVDLPPDRRSVGVEVWGRGTYTGGAPVGPDCFYWFATAPADVPTPASVADIRSYFATYPEPVPTVVDSLEPADVIATGLNDLPALDRWHRGSTVLAGDAAHGMLPFAGQGAAQSVEDAVALAHALDANGTPRDAFTAYESERVDRANRVRAESRRLGRLGTLQSSVACRLRNAAAYAFPATLFERIRRRRVANASVPDDEPGGTGGGGDPPRVSSSR
ncbi:FAD-dependent oxidoreductase [Halostella litorea]|uniref:FAD-dependent oxidoreductase n=1 Tax=Halostella litorea TaxID=2528831 RepID=UPI001091D449|nr:FAD-dependent oxidoreductase [Halostella litorea]